jgi:antitoxin VapB
METDVGIFIRNSAAEDKIRELADRTGETITEAVERAVEERLARLPQPTKKKGRLNRKALARLLVYFDSLPKTNEHLTDDEIIGYDEFGVPKAAIALA